jgi:starch synthase
LRLRQHDLRGIVNGIDTDIWSPSKAPMLVERYDASNVEEGKAQCKAWLQRHAGLAERPDVPLFAQIGRLDPQKGWDLMAEVAEPLLEKDVQFVVLGDGNPRYHTLIENLARRHPHKFWAHLGFSDDLAHQIEAGADLFLMPSLFEPCGLNQLYSLAHGTVPLVRATGGLADTVVDTTPQTLADGSATGFVFAEPAATALWQTIERALALRTDRAAWLKLMKTGMSADWSWERSARDYAQLYAEICRKVSSREPLQDSSESSIVPPAKAGTA